MRVPVAAIVPGTAIRITTGNQFRGDGNPGNQLQDESTLFFKRRTDRDWAAARVTFDAEIGNNKYFSASIPQNTFTPGDVVEYYCRIAYDDHSTTFLHGADATSDTTADEATAQSTPFMFTVADSASTGLWSPVFSLPNVAVHATVLVNGLVLIWGRRDRPDQSLDERQCTPFLWDPATREVTETPQPEMADGTKVNLFCSGHAYLPDGRVLVAGGHRTDGDGLDQAVVYDPATNAWSAAERMNNGRWYPTVTALPDGSVLVISGSYKQNGETINNFDPQLWIDGTWFPVASIPDNEAFDLYPRMHAVSDGRIVMCGPKKQTWSLEMLRGGSWTRVAERANGQRDYAPSVAYGADKVIYIGGGNEPGTREPTAATETLDMAEDQPRWRPGTAMHFPRRHHNATILADGKLLVTGGTRGGGNLAPDPPGFNDLNAGQPVHLSELWDPATGQWTVVAAEQVDRCYHATAVLLPDATVLSAGGGEYARTGNVENDPQDSHRDAQIFSPQYLFKGARPQITSAPQSVGYGDSFQVGTNTPTDIGKVTWIGLSSVTHSINMSQSINLLSFQVGPDSLTVSAPESPDESPLGHYMLFIVSKQGIPSVARIIRIVGPVDAPVAPAALRRQGFRLTSTVSTQDEEYPDAYARRAAVVRASTGTTVVVGVTGTCPYGIAACWGGASEALRTLEGVEAVDPIPDAEDSTAKVFLVDDRLPPFDRWQEQFERLVNGTYELRGVEVTLDGAIEPRDGKLFLEGSEQRRPVELSPLGQGDKVQWDRAAGAPKALAPDEATAFERLISESGGPGGGRRVTVTGPLEQDDSGYRMKVRLFSF